MVHDDRRGPTKRDCIGNHVQSEFVYQNHEIIPRPFRHFCMEGLNLGFVKIINGSEKFPAKKRPKTIMDTFEVSPL